MSPTPKPNAARILAPTSESEPAAARIMRAPPTYVGHSAPARRVQAHLARAARARGPMLIVGDQGTGKTVVARIAHHFSGQPGPMRTLGAQDGLNGPFGAFTYIGNLEDFSLVEQARIPGLVQPGQRVVLGTRLRPVSEDGRARLHPQVVRWASALRVELPTLRERVEDLELIAMGLLSRMPSSRAIGSIADDALDSLRSYDWGGNVDELTVVLREAVEVGQSHQIELRDLPPGVRVHDVAEGAEEPEQALSLREIEREAIQRALRYARGNKRRASRILGIGKTTLYRKLRLYGLLGVDLE